MVADGHQPHKEPSEFSSPDHTTAVVAKGEPTSVVSAVATNAFAMRVMEQVPVFAAETVNSLCI